MKVGTGSREGSYKCNTCCLVYSFVIVWGCTWEKKHRKQWIYSALSQMNTVKMFQQQSLFYNWMSSDLKLHCIDSFSLCLLNTWWAKCFFVLNVVSHKEQGKSPSMWTGHPGCVEWAFCGTWNVCYTCYKQNHQSLLLIFPTSIALILFRWIFF